MARVAKGDQDAFAALFDRYQGSVYRFALRVTQNSARAEELTQEIFLRLYSSAGRYRPSAAFKTYLFRVATNHCLNELRRREYKQTVDPPGERTTPIEDDEPSTLPSPEQTLAGKELERAVNHALASLSERERLAFTLCRFEGLSYRDIAQALSATEPAVKSLIHRATLSVARHVHGASSRAEPLRSEA